MASEPNVSELFKHVVILEWRKTSDEVASVRDFAVGFLVIVLNEWHIVTAGHIFSDLEKELSEGTRQYQWILHDGLSTDSQWNTGIPFSPIEQRRICFNQPGIDFALIHVPHIIRDNLQKNGKVPFIENMWEEPEALGQNVNYVMLGSPAEKLIEKSPHHTFRALAKIHITRVRPSDVPEFEGKSKLYFFGKLKSIPINTIQGETIHSLKGMSGGPVLKVYHHPSGKITYKVIAVQSGCTEPSGFTTATYIRPLLELLQESTGDD